MSQPGCPLAQGASVDFEGTGFFFLLDVVYEQ